MLPPVASKANQYLVPATRLNGVTGTVFQAAARSVVELPIVRSVSGCPLLSLYTPTNTLVAVAVST
jgi:hypothetical protein